MVGVKEPASLELREIAKHYGGLRAVDGVSTVAEPGEVLGIAGPNGAGKTTLFDVVSGLTPATAGDVLLGGEPIAALSVHRRCHRGMARTFQQPTVAGSLTTYENLLVAAKYGRAGEHWNGLGADAVDDAEWALDWSGLAAKADEPAELLGVFDKKRLMIATAVVLGPRTLLLDEPFGGLNDAEIDTTLTLIQAVAGFGVAVVCIEHVMRALVKLSARVLVMHQGKPFFEGTPQAMLKDRRVIEIYLGEKAARNAG
ncbi:ATP-binding cassette domain-containing protein [Conexibacter sp. JD483]|uniref:ABC transporter ATP-binding protein n=1 Tax=unclassified Conexibacter TaxID=2627773 RepID=UPI002715CC09|nr:MULTISPECIES: ATP-binding cassette domain-containing protein [unclassified Conexibacter]MDO8186946.1 ATP-binding cassette domain-containing protein [Conexibacter sp. CPCC 205706]MDO8200599.1 ATP-binding cassette domain-containing protein [Conexibacter sp. CPCC 205762]MDR9368823.1 ATP-binding cassette domain-containing protein [Conexibacter sp. JD483]